MAEKVALSIIFTKKDATKLLMQYSPIQEFRSTKKVQLIGFATEVRERAAAVGRVATHNQKENQCSFKDFASKLGGWPLYAV
ncbi:MAG: hypothetical protein ACLT1C_05455 [Weissella confusa]